MNFSNLFLEFGRGRLVKLDNSVTIFEDPDAVLHLTLPELPDGEILAVDLGVEGFVGGIAGAIEHRADGAGFAPKIFLSKIEVGLFLKGTSFSFFRWCCC